MRRLAFGLVAAVVAVGGACASLQANSVVSPRDLDEAAKIDGAGYGRIFWSILLPLSRPALITVAIFSFLAHWNEFITPLIFLNSTENCVLSLGVRHLQTLPTSEPARDHLLMAAATLITLTPIAVFIALQRYFTGLKG